MESVIHDGPHILQQKTYFQVNVHGKHKEIKYGARNMLLSVEMARPLSDAIPRTLLPWHPALGFAGSLREQDCAPGERSGEFIFFPFGLGEPWGNGSRHEIC